MSDLEKQIWQPLKDQGVKVYGLYSGESPVVLQAFIDQHGITFPTIQSSTASQFNYPPGTGYPYPRDIIIGKNLKIASIKQSFNMEEVVPLVQALLAE